MTPETLSKLTGQAWVAEHRFCERRWRFDFACVDLQIAIEVEGGAYTRGRHTRGSGFIADMEKYNRAAIDGWLLLRFTPQQIKSGAFFDSVLKAVKKRKLGGA